MDTLKIDKIYDIFDNYVSNENFSGVALVKKGDDILFNKAYGYAHRGWKIPNYLDTKFDTASITKMFTAVSILQLVDRGLIHLDNKIFDIIDIGESKLNPNIKIYHLLTHTSGIGDDADEEAGESYEAIWLEKPNYTVKETSHYLPNFIHKKQNFEPGAGCRYNNCAYILLGLVIEKVTGVNYRDYVVKNIFDEVGMKNTGFYSMDQVVEKGAEHYASIEDEEGNISNYRKNIYSYPSIGSADAGALTTPSDLDLFIRSLKDGKLLSKELTEEIFKPKELYKEYGKVTQFMGYGFQFFKRNDNGEIFYIQKDGINAGVSCIMNYYPDSDLSIIIMSNHDSNVWDLAWEVQGAVLGKF